MADATVRLTSNASTCMEAIDANTVAPRACNTSSPTQRWFRDETGQLRSLNDGNRAAMPVDDTRSTGEVRLTNSGAWYAGAVWQFKGGGRQLLHSTSADVHSYTPMQVGASERVYNGLFCLTYLLLRAAASKNTAGIDCVH